MAHHVVLLQKWVVDKEATATQKGSKHEECKVCGYKKAAVEIPATGTPTEPGKPTDSDSPQTGDNSNIILWIALLFISGGTVIGITVYSKKKKENAESIIHSPAVCADVSFLSPQEHSCQWLSASFFHSLP